MYLSESPGVLILWQQGHQSCPENLAAKIPFQSHLALGIVTLGHEDQKAPKLLVSQSELLVKRSPANQNKEKTEMYLLIAETIRCICCLRMCSGEWDINAIVESTDETCNSGYPSRRRIVCISTGAGMIEGVKNLCSDKKSKILI